MKQDKHALWDGLNFVYRKMVYAEALTGMHPSRFYYTVPVCGCCHRVYSLMDIARSRVHDYTLYTLYNTTHQNLPLRGQFL